MSDQSQGPGWWQASDGKWYAPETHPNYVPPPPGASGAVSATAAPMTTRDAKAQGKADKAYKKAQRPFWKKKRFIIPVALIVLIIIIVAASSGSKDKNNNASNNDLSNGPPPASADMKVGQTGHTSDFDVTVYGYKDPQPPPTSGVDTPKAGNHYVSVDVQVKNTSSDQQSFSSLLAFHLLDAQNRQYDETVTTISPSAPEGEVAKGQAIRGFVVFEVPNGTTGLRFRTQGSITASGDVWKLGA
jgi:hypothetical protein